MPKSAQQKFNEYLDECRETNIAVNEFTKASYDNHGGYAYATGYFESVVKDLIGQLPKAKRAELRKQFLDMAQKQKNEALINQLKASDNVDPWKTVTV
jgi:hypothetical protein